MLYKIALFVLILILTALPLVASDLQETLQSLTGSAGAAYVNPLVSTFGSDVNGGWFHQVPSAVQGKWNFEIGVVGMGSFWGNASETFDVTGQFRFTRTQAEELTQGSNLANGQQEALINQIMAQDFNLEISGPTVIGPSYDDATGANSIVVHFTQQTVNYQYNNQTFQADLPNRDVSLGVGGLLKKLPGLPMAAPELTIGTWFGTNLMFRYLPDLQLDPKIGKVSYVGYGLQNNPLFWLNKPLPVDVAVAFYTQSIKVGSIMTSTAYTYGINLAKTFGSELVHVTPYLGVSGESSKMKFSYDYPTGSTNPDFVPETLKIKFDVSGQNSARLTTGISFRIALVNLNFDYNFAKYPSATAGAMLNFSF